MKVSLADYISRHTDAICAERFGVKLRTVASWRRGENFPRAKKAREIILLSNGELTMDSIYRAATDESEAAA